MTEKTLERIQIAGLLLTLATHISIGLFANAYFERGWASWSSFGGLERRPDTTWALVVAVVALSLGCLMLWISNRTRHALRDASPEVQRALSSGRRVTFFIGLAAVVEATAVVATLSPETYEGLRVEIWTIAIGSLGGAIFYGRAFFRHLKDPRLKEEWDRLFVKPPT